MRSFFFQYKTLLLALVLLLLGLHLSSSALDKGEATGPLGRTVLAVYAPIHGLLSWPFRKSAELAGRYLLLVDVAEENRRLQSEVEGLRFEVGRLSESQIENERLRALLKFPAPPGVTPIHANVIARNLSSEVRTLLVGKGTKDGVDRNMIAVTADGLVGHVSEAVSGAARIMLTTDSSSVVDSIVQRTRASGLVRGRSRDTCTMEFIQRTDDVVPGDVIISSGIGGVFPKGHVVGQVVLVDKDSNDMFQVVEIRPAVDATRLEEVVVLPGSPIVTDLGPRPEPAAAPE